MSMRSIRRVTLAALLAVAWPAPLLAQDSWLSLNLGRFTVRGADTRVADDVLLANLLPLVRAGVVFVDGAPSRPAGRPRRSGRKPPDHVRPIHNI